MSGKKYDQSKSPLVDGCFTYFPDALEAVAFISQYGCKKYELEFKDKNWKDVENGEARYKNAAGRHLVREGYDHTPGGSGLLHAAHAAWNALAALQLAIERGETVHPAEEEAPEDPAAEAPGWSPEEMGAYHDKEALDADR